MSSFPIPKMHLSQFKSVLQELPEIFDTMMESEGMRRLTATQRSPCYDKAADRPFAFRNVEDENNLAEGPVYGFGAINRLPLCSLTGSETIFEIFPPLACLLNLSVYVEDVVVPAAENSGDSRQKSWIVRSDVFVRSTAVGP